jgi:hypothetical protein
MPSPCAPGVDRWVSRAAVDTGVDIRTAWCSSERVIVRLSPAATPSLDVEIAQGDGPAFRRAGPFRLSPLLEVDDFSTVPQGQRDGFAAFATWIEAHPGDVTFDASALPGWAHVVTPKSDASLGGPWLLLAAAVLLAASRVRSRRLPARDVQLLGVAFVAALALRLALGAWGPLHVNGQAAIWILSATTSPDETAFYGPGYGEVFGSLARLAGTAPDTAIFAANAVLSALVAALAYAIGRLAGVARPVAVLAPMALAVDPIAIRMAATETYFVPLIALTLGATALGLAAAHHAASGERPRALALALAASLLLAQVVRIHPSGWVAAALAPLAALACGARLRLPRRLAGALALYVLSAGVIAVTSARVIAGVSAHMAAGDLLRPAFVAPPVILVVCVVAAVALLLWASPSRWLAAIGALHLAVLLLVYGTTVQGAFWVQANARLLLTMPVIALGSCVPAAWLQARAPRAAVLAAGLVALGLGRRILVERPTQHLEYRWTRAFLSSLPEGCRTLNVTFAGAHRLFMPTYVASSRPQASFLRVDTRHPVDLGQMIGAPRCTFYVHTSLCSTGEGRAACDAVERDLALEPVARTSLPAVADSDFADLRSDPVEIVVSKVVAVRAP